MIAAESESQAFVELVQQMKIVGEEIYYTTERLTFPGYRLRKVESLDPAGCLPTQDRLPETHVET